MFICLYIHCIYVYHIHIDISIHFQSFRPPSPCLPHRWRTSPTKATSALRGRGPRPPWSGQAAAPAQPSCASPSAGVLLPAPPPWDAAITTALAGLLCWELGPLRVAPIQFLPRSFHFWQILAKIKVALQDVCVFTCQKKLFENV